VRLRLLEVIGELLEQVTALEDVSALRRQAEMVVQSAKATLPEPLDRLAVEELYYQISARWLREQTRPGAGHDGEVASGTIVTTGERPGAAVAHPNDRTRVE